jgi:hypothetical protein
MKRTSQFFAAATLLVAVACQDAISAPASDDVDAARSANKSTTGVTVRAESYGPDGTIIYSVRVWSNSRTLSSFQGTVYFPPGSFDLRSHTPTPVSNGMVMVNIADAANGRIRFSAYTQTSYNALGVGVEVFRFAARPRYGNPDLSAALEVVSTTVPTSSASAGIAAANVSSSGGACSGTSLWGDGNADGAVNITDAQQLARYSTGMAVGNPTAVTTRGDVTADGQVNIVDAQQIARYSVGLSAASRTSTWIC